MLLVVWGPPFLAASTHLWTPGSQSNSLGAGIFCLPGLALIALVAPLVGYRRRDWLLILIPLWGLGTTLLFGARLAKLANSRTAYDGADQPSGTGRDLSRL
jgi:hypothetical protein